MTKKTLSKIDSSIQLARYFDSGNIEIIISISDYNQMIADRDKKRISEFIFGRLNSRYIKPFSFDSAVFNKQYKNGFSMMANYCLLIETLESFKHGWGDSNRKSELAFKNFLANDKNFEELKSKGTQFYTNIRCGILHQGETTGGWKITRNSKKFYDEVTNSINAYKFGQKLEKSLKEYCELLNNSEWDSEVWDNFRRKMRRIIANCAV